MLFERKTNGATKKRQEGARAAKIVELEAGLQNKNDVMAELLEKYVNLKKQPGALNRKWIPHNIRDAVVDFIRDWSEKTGIVAKYLLKWTGLWSGNYHKWVRHYGQAFEQNGKIPRDHWLD